MEIAMIVTLALMGFYFIKSTDLPKDLKDRSTHLRENSPSEKSNAPARFNFPKDIAAAPSIDARADIKLAEMKLQKKLKEIKLLNDEIDKLTLAITSLEQEIKINNERNSEIQRTIDSHLAELARLQEKVALLS